ncbi:hypothetical protein SAMN05519104_6665 [Rhizobiales bacterium GAS188]|nr:hypothetical protein SAMN05519104_6665 [Rhizobiales bacterium GAS188]
MADTSRALTLRFATDVQPVKQAVESLAKNIVLNMATIGGAGILAGKGIATITPGLASAGAAAAKTGLQFGTLMNVLKLVEAYKIAALGLAAFGAVAAVAAEQVDKLQKIAEASREAGVNSTFFQIWNAQADELHLKVGDLQSALTHFREQLRATPDDVSNFEKVSTRLFTGERNAKGDVTKNPLFTNGAPSLGREFFSADTAEQKIRAVIDAMKELVKQGDIVAAQWVGGQMFGNKVGDAEVEALQKGRDLLAEQADKARALGTVFDEGMVKKADELHDRLEKARQDMADGLMPVMKDLAGLGLRLNEGWVQFEELVGKAILKVGQLYTAMKSLPGPGEAMKTVQGSVNRQGAQIAAAWPGNTPEEKEIFAGRAKAPVVLAPYREPGHHAGEGEDAQLPEFVGNVPLPPTKPNILSAKKEAKTAAAKSETDTTTSLERQITSLEKAASLAKAEVDTFGLGNQAKERAVDLAKAQAAAEEDVKKKLRDSATLTADEVAQINKAADATVKYRDEVKKLEAAQQEANDRVKTFADLGFQAFEGIATGSKKASDALRDMAKSLADMVLKAALLGEGPLASAFGMKADGQGGAQVGGIFGMLAKAAIGSIGGAAGAAATSGSYAYPAEAIHSHALGGVMTSRGPMPLRRYASGGIASSPQLAMFGEGSGSEAYVPLPDGRAIPVSLRMPQMPAAAPGGASVNMPVHIHNNHAGADVTTKPREGGGLDVIVNALQSKIVDNMARGQGSARAMSRVGDGSHLRG